MQLGFSEWLGILGGLIGVASLPLAPLRRPVYRFNTWYDAKSRERTANRLIALREQLQELQDRTDHLHFQRKVSGGLLALTFAFLIWFLRAVRGQGDHQTESSFVLIIMIAFIAAIWQFGSAFRRLSGAKETELRENIVKYEMRLKEFDVLVVTDKSAQPHRKQSSAKPKTHLHGC